MRGFISPKAHFSIRCHTIKFRFVSDGAPLFGLNVNDWISISCQHSWIMHSTFFLHQYWQRGRAISNLCCLKHCVHSSAEKRGSLHFSNGKVKFFFSAFLFTQLCITHTHNIHNCILRSLYKLDKKAIDLALFSFFCHFFHAHTFCANNVRNIYLFRS